MNSGGVQGRRMHDREVPQSAQGLRKAGCLIWPHFLVPGQLWSGRGWVLARLCGHEEDPENRRRNDLLPQTSYSHFLRNWGKGSLPCVNFNCCAFGSFVLKRVPRPNSAQQESVSWLINRTAQGQDGVLWLVRLEIHTAAFRREICYSLCQTQGMFL